MDSFIQRLSSNKWPMRMQAQRSATKRFMETTEAWSEVVTIPNFPKKPSSAIAAVRSSSSSSRSSRRSQSNPQESIRRIRTIFSVQSQFSNSKSLAFGSLSWHSKQTLPNETKGQNTEKQREHVYEKTRINFLLLSCVFSLTKQRVISFPKRNKARNYSSSVFLCYEKKMKLSNF